MRPPASGAELHDVLRARFEDPATLVDALRAQELIAHNPTIVERLLALDVVDRRLRGYAAGDAVIDPADVADQSVHFILAGRVDVRVRGNLVAERPARQHVGEMACIEPTAPRSAKCKALEPTVTVAIGPKHFREIANAFPEVWEGVARTLGHRLRQRGDREREANERPQVFLGSSSEGLRTLGALERALACDELRLEHWKAIFRPSRYTLDELSDKAFRSDFAVLLLRDDDVSHIRGKRHSTTRDNVVLELGLFVGRLSRPRVFIVTDETRGRVKLPSDLDGVTRLVYRAGARAGAPESLKEVAAAIRRFVIDQGVRFAGLNGEKP